MDPALAAILQAWPFGKVLLLAGLLVTMVPIMADRSRHRPGNLAPIQLISAIGGWALLLLDEAMLVASLREGSPIVSCASLATLLTTLWLFLRRDDGPVVSDQAPETIDAMIREIEQILGGTPRIGIESVAAVIVAGNGPFIGVGVSRRGHVVVRVRQDLLPWLELHQRSGGARSAEVRSLLRFTVLHELGHVLNGDHLTYRFVRSVLVAHLWWIAAAVVALATLPWDGPAAGSALVTALCLAPPFIAQCLLARRFLAEREEVADARAMQTLDPSDAKLLLTRSGRRTGRPNPTVLEKLMISLNVQTPPARRAARPLTTTIRWVWPEAGAIRTRCELLVSGQSRTGQPNQWAACIGLQCALLSVSLLNCASAAFSSWPFWRSGLILRVTLFVMALICAMAATYCGLRVDPALVHLHDIRRVPARWMVGAILYLSFSVSAFLLYLLPAFSSMAGVLSFPLFSLSVAVSAPQVILGSLAAAARAEGGPEGAARALRHPVLRAAPAILIASAIIIFCTIVAAWTFGLGVPSAAWQGIVIVTFVGTTASIVSSRSPNAAVRATPPIALLDSPGNIYAIRIFWRELYFDRANTPDTRIGLIGLTTYAGMALFFACAAAFAASVIGRVATEEVVFQNLLLISAVLAGAQALVPKRTSTTAHLYDLEHLQMFDSLLAAARTARLPTTDRLSQAVALWMRSDTALPHAVLPERRAIWKLESLLLLVRIARAVGEDETVAKWRRPIVESLRRIVTGGAVTLNGSRPSLGYSVLAAQIVEETRLAPDIPMEPMLDSIEDQLERWLNGERGASAEAVVSACRLMGAHGRPAARADRIRMRSIMGIEYLLTRPIIRHALSELVAYTALLEDTAVRDRLANVVRSRMWEALQLNPGNDVPLLLDCYLAAVSLGEKDSPRLNVAESTIGGIAERMADELTKVCRTSAA